MKNFSKWKNNLLSKISSIIDKLRYGKIAPKVRYRIKDIKRFTAVLLVLVLCTIAVVVALDDSLTPVKAVVNAISPTATPTPTPIPTPTPTPTPTPVPTPTPTPIPPGKVLKDVLIVLDPGHGGRDPGTVNDAEKVYEKDIVLDMSKKAGNILNQNGINVLYTRESDIHLDNNVISDLKKRCAIANENDATLYVSIHVNGHDNTSVSGTEIWYNAGRTYFNGFTAKHYATLMREEIMKSANTNDHGIITTSKFAVLNYPKMPSLIVETAFISNEGDYAKLKTQDFRQQMANGISQGVIRVLNELGAKQENGKWTILVDQ